MKFITNFNVELWNIHQQSVLQVLNEKETIPVRKAEKLAKEEMSRHNFKMSRHNLNRTSRSYVATRNAMSQQRIEVELKLEVKNVGTFHNFIATQNERD